MPFLVGADVVVLSLGRTGRVVDAARGGRYRVRVGAVVMQCREEELGESNRVERHRGRKRRPGGRVPEAPSHAPFSPQSGQGRRATNAEQRRLSSLDLHGFTVQEALTKVEEHLDLALRAGLESVEIIHGRSSGRIKLAVHRLLRDLTAVRRFELRPDNPGVTRVFF